MKRRNQAKNQCNAINDWADRLKLTAHGIQPHKAADVVVKVHVPILITVSANDHLEQLIIEGEA